MYLGKWGDLYLILYIFVWKFKVSLNYFQTGGGDGGHLKLVRGWHCNKEGGWFSQVKVENVFDFESSFLCFPLFLLFNSCPSWHQNRKLRWVSYLVTHFACFDLSVPVANWFWVPAGSASIRLVTVYKGLFSRDHRDLWDTISKMHLEQVLSWPSQGWSSDHELINEPRSSQVPRPAWGTVLLLANRARFLLPEGCGDTLKPLGNFFFFSFIHFSRIIQICKLGWKLPITSSGKNNRFGGIPFVSLLMCIFS